jgi:hypothetical protein
MTPLWSLCTATARIAADFRTLHMKAGKLVHCTVSPQQAAILRLAIANYRKAKKLMKAAFWAF